MLLPLALAQEPAPEAPAAGAEAAAGEAAEEALVKPPELLAFVQAPYPPEAEAAGIEGSVLLLVEIDATGVVTQVSVQTPAGHGFDEAAVEAARQLRFKPAEDATGPVPVLIEFAYGFKLEPREAPPAELPVTLEGELLEMATRRPIAGAAVTAKGPNGEDLGTATTDDAGRFSLRGVPPGTVALVARHPAYQDSDAEVDVVAGEVTQATLWLRNRDYAAEGIVGIYQRERPPEVTRRTITIEEVRRVPGTFGDPVRVIQSLPGAARSPFSLGLLVLRGANPEDSNVYVDGVEVPLVYHLGGFRSILNPNVIDAVDYLPGGFGVRYGRSIGGVVDVQTQHEYPEQVHASLRTDFLDTGVYAEGRYKKLGFAIGGRRSYIDALLGVALAKQEFYAAPRWSDYQVKLELLDTADDLSLLFFGFDDELIVRTSADAEDQLGFSYSTQRLVLRWRHDLAEDLSLELQPALGVDGTKLGFGSVVSFDIDALVVDLRGELAWKPSDKLRLALGTDAEAGRYGYSLSVGAVPVDGDNPLSESEPFLVEDGVWRGMPDLYAEAQLRPLKEPEDLVLVAGARVPVLIRTDEPPVAAIDPRMAARMRLVEGGTLKLGGGLYTQPPQGVEFGSDVPFERGYSGELGWEQQFTPAISADVTGYFRWMDPLSTSFDGDDTGVGRAYGMELMVRHARVDRFFGWLSYTLSRSERNDRPEDPEGWYFFDFDQSHIFTAVAGYRLPFDIELGARAQYVTGNPYTPYSGGIYLMDDGGYVPYATAETNSSRLPPYWAVDIRAEKLFTFKRWQLSTFVDVLGLLHGINPEFQLYNYDYTESDYIRGLPTIPSLGAQAEIHF